MQSSLESLPGTASDSELLARFAASADERAFAELVRRYSPLVLSITRRRLGGSGLAEDAAQQVFIALSVKVRKLGQIPCLVAWLQKVAVYEAGNIARRESRHRQRAQQAEGLWNGPEEAKNERTLDEALAALPERDREILMLHHFEKLPYERAASRLGITAEAAQRRGHRALGKLRELLTRQGVTCDEKACAIMIAGAVDPAAKVSPAFMAKTLSLKKAAAVSVPRLPIAAVIALSSAAVVAAKIGQQPDPPPPSSSPFASTSGPRERPVTRKREPRTPDDKLSPEMSEFITLARKDSKQAWEWVKDREDWETFLQQATPELADRDTPAAERLLEMVEGRSGRTALISGIFDSRAEANFESAVVWIDAFGEDYERRAISDSMNVYINTEDREHDYAGALKLTRSPEVRRWLVDQACERFADLDESGIEKMAIALEGDDKRVALGWAASLLLQRGDPRAFVLLDEAKPAGMMFPDPAKISARDPEAVLNWIARQNDGENRHHLAETIWLHWARQDAEAAVAWARTANAETNDIAKKFKASFDPTANRLMKQP